MNCQFVIHYWFNSVSIQTENNLDEIKADDNIETGHNDNDDSLNLTIGEEEEHFLNEENYKKGVLNNL